MSKTWTVIIVIIVILLGIWIFAGGDTNETTNVNVETEGAAGTQLAGSEVGPITLNIEEQNDSGLEGTAVLSMGAAGGTDVVFDLTGAPATTPQPAHIHVGECPTPGSVKYPLNNLVNGKSTTHLDVPLSQLEAELPLAINVHKSAAESNVFVGCVDLDF